MKKKALLQQELGWWIIAIIILVLVIIGLYLMQKKGINVIEQLKNFLRFGR
ncbi:MAG: hypothetical protein NZ889_00300 [Candidatus Pacearchaeota archaeon]|nr:hypothetical protein [Candidatus Pacearchaeota archaeon]